jgi:predicted dehydrogenase
MRVAVLGYGYWGPNVARVFRATGCDVLVVDQLRQRLDEAEKVGFPVRPVWNPEARDVDAVAICTPPRTHYDLALDAIRQGKHVLVAKPLTLDVTEAERLLTAAFDHVVALMVDHTFVYSPAVARLAREVADCTPTFYDSVRMNLGTTQAEGNVIWDLGAHDVSIMLHVLGYVKPIEVRTVMNGRHQAYVAYRFQDGLVAHSHLNWVAPAKVRQTIIGCDHKMIVYDDVVAHEKLRVYTINGGMPVATDETTLNRMTDYRLGDMVAPALSTREPLEVMAERFITGCETRQVDRQALDVVRILAAAEAAAETDSWVSV